LITHSDVAAYDRDGVVCLRQAFDAAWVERLRAAVERDLAAGVPMTCDLFPRVWPKAA
jgi:hypothetical protein